MSHSLRIYIYNIVYSDSVLFTSSQVFTQRPIRKAKADAGEVNSLFDEVNCYNLSTKKGRNGRDAGKRHKYLLKEKTTMDHSSQKH